MAADVGVVRGRQARVPRAAQVEALTYVFVHFVGRVGPEFIVEGGRPYAGKSAAGEACMQVELHGALVVRFRETPIDVVSRGGSRRRRTRRPGPMGRERGTVRSRHRKVRRKLEERDATGPLCPRNGYEDSYCLAVIDGIVRLFGIGLCSWRRLQTSGSAVRLIAADGWGTDRAILRLTRAAGKQGKVSSPKLFRRSLR